MGSVRGGFRTCHAYHICATTSFGKWKGLLRSPCSDVLICTGREPTQLQTCARKGVSREKFAFRPFFLKADNTIRVIQQAFAAFDFRGLGESLPVPENVGRYTLLLNAINLFFVRGMYMETPFFPLLQLQKGFEASDEQPEPLKPAPGPEQSRQDSV